MTREIEVERTARILKQAEPGHAPPRRSSNLEEPVNPMLAVSLIAGIVAFIVLLVAILAT